MDKSFPIHVRTLSGVETLLADELRDLGAQDIRVENRVVLCRGDLALLYKLNLWCRLAIRVLRPLASFPAPNEKALYNGVRAIDWSPWLSATGTLSVDAAVYSSFTTHSLFVAQLAKDAVVDQFRDKTGKRPSVDREPDLRIVLSLFEGTAQVFVDSSGESLHKRGYRLKAGEAPLRETLAAAMVKLSGWDGTVPLVDPMCGSGTILIEAGLRLKNFAPGLLRSGFGFQRWRDYDRVLWERLKSQGRREVRGDAAAVIVGVDKDPQMVTVARENIQRAGLGDLIRIEEGDFFTWEGKPATPGKLIFNPPYDERMSVDDVAEFYQRIGDRLKRQYGGWSAFLISGNAEAVKYLGLRTSSRRVLFNGAMECRFLEYGLRSPVASSEPPRYRDAEKNPRWVQKAEVFGNRLKKNLKNQGKKAQREGLSDWRLYDWDIPEFPFYVDISANGMRFTEVPRNHGQSPIEHATYMKLMVKTAADVAGVPPENIRVTTGLPERPIS